MKSLWVMNQSLLPRSINTEQFSICPSPSCSLKPLRTWQDCGAEEVEKILLQGEQFMLSEVLPRSLPSPPSGDQCMRRSSTYSKNKVCSSSWSKPDISTPPKAILKLYNVWHAHGTSNRPADKIPNATSNSHFMLSPASYLWLLACVHVKHLSAFWTNMHSSIMCLSTVLFYDMLLQGEQQMLTAMSQNHQPTIQQQIQGQIHQAILQVRYCQSQQISGTASNVCSRGSLSIAILNT